jgi:hypothetical protein
METRPYHARVFTHDRGNFKEVKKSNVLIYWPHGFGDWVHLSSITPFLEESNRYWITRYGDDNVAVFDGHASVLPCYLGVNATHNGDGAGFGNRHFGLDYEKMDGSLQCLDLPLTLHDLCRRHDIQTVLWSSYPESWGYAEFPYHTKPRQLMRSLVSGEKRDAIDLARPLPSSLEFAVNAPVTTWVESRLRNFTGWGRNGSGRKLCLIGRNGYTSIEKNWGHEFREDLPEGERHEGQECRDFMRLLLRKDSQWVFLVIEDRLFEGEHTVRDKNLHAFSYAELFGTPDSHSLPHALVMKALVNCAELCIGVPAGPYHLAMAKKGLPCVGLWIAHHPSWYDEPKAESLHILSRNIRDQALDQRPGSFTRQGALLYDTIDVETRVITGKQVLEAVERLLY